MYKTAAEAVEIARHISEVGREPVRVYQIRVRKWYSVLPLRRYILNSGDVINTGILLCTIYPNGTVDQ